MNEQENKELLRQRLRAGENLRKVGHQNGNYVVALTDEPPLVFSSSEEDQIDRILHENGQI